MKRKLNRSRKEFQVFLHKANLIGWVAHGNFVNSQLNDTQLMANALKLLPKNKNHCYPTDKTDVDYFQQITNWFKSTIKLNNKDMYCVLKKRPPIKTSLALQIKFKAAICRRDYVLIFAILLRAIGVQCRVVQSLVCAPMFPPKSDLLSLAKKPEVKSKENGTSKSSSSKSSHSRSKAKSSSKISTSSHKSPEKSSRSSRSGLNKSMKIPQLDGGDDLPRGSKKPLKIKALPGYKVDESYVDLNKEKLSKKKAGESSKNRSMAEESSSGTKMAPRVRFSMDSPNRAKSPSEKLFKSKNPIKKVQEKESAKAISPRKTRSKSENVETSNLESSGIPKIERENSSKSTPKDTLQVFSPRRLRSRSRSNEGDNPKSSGIENKPKTSPSSSKASAAASKPNLKNLQKLNDRKRPSSSNEEIDVIKKSKVSGKKRIAEAPVVEKVKKVKLDEIMSDDSAKYFKNPSSLKKKLKPAIDRRVLSSDDDSETNVAQESPKKQNDKRINIWIEVYSEKDERWLSIDVLRNKVDCIPEISKAATQPMIYVFAWNNDNSLKDVSHRYCPNLNTVTRKLRADPKYVESIIGQFVGLKTARDVKEDDELNKQQLKIPLPTSIMQ